MCNTHIRIIRIISLFGQITMTAYDIPVGSRVVVDLPPIRHHGRYLGNGLVAHNSKKNRMVCIESIADFADGKPFRWTPPSRPVDPNEFASMAKSLAGQRYSLFGFNCEHFANLLIDHKATSRQVSATLGGIGIGVLLALATKRDLRQALILAVSMGLGGLILSNWLDRTA